tara:strand:- start:141 stop:1142 length:1002 start_codon:yes stop_codon:yes gene_type:complete
MKKVVLSVAVIGGLYYLYTQDKRGGKRKVKMKSVQQVKDYFDSLIIDDMPTDIDFWIVGGSVADVFTIGRVRNDVDMYFPNQESFDKALQYFTENGKITYDNKNSVKVKTSKYEVDLVKHFSASREGTVERADYTICSGAVDRNGVYISKDFAYAIKNKKLEVNSLCNAIGMTKRIKKYAKRGYDLSNSEFQKIVNKIAVTDANELYSNVIYGLNEGIDITIDDNKDDRRDDRREIIRNDNGDIEWRDTRDDVRDDRDDRDDRRDDRDDRRDDRDDAKSDYTYLKDNDKDDVKPIDDARYDDKKTISNKPNYALYGGIGLAVMVVGYLIVKRK